MSDCEQIAHLLIFEQKKWTICSENRGANSRPCLYAIQIWSCLRAGPLNDLFKNAKIRNSCNHRLFLQLSHYTTFLKAANSTSSLSDLLSFNKLQFMQIFNQNFLPSPFNDTWVKHSLRVIGENDIQLRNFDQLRLTLANLTYLAYFPFTTSPKLWQDFLDEQIKIICKLCIIWIWRETQGIFSWWSCVK